MQFYFYLCLLLCIWYQLFLLNYVVGAKSRQESCYLSNCHFLKAANDPNMTNILEEDELGLLFHNKKAKYEPKIDQKSHYSRP